MGLLQRANLALLRAIGLLDAEQLDLHEVGRDGGRVDDDKRPIRTCRKPVQMASGKLFARARGPDDHDPAVGGRDLLDRLAELVDRRRTADHADRHGRERLQVADLALEARGFERPVSDQHQTVGLEWLLDEIVGAALYGGDGGFDVAMAGDHHHRHFRVLLLDGIEQLQAVEPAALEPDVEEQKVGAARLDLVQGGIAVARGAGGVAFILEQARDQFADVGLVINNENI